MRLSDVRAGMRCTGLSVVRGTAISSFGVEVTKAPRNLRPGRRVLVLGPTAGESVEDALLELLEGAFAEGGLSLAEEGAGGKETGDLPVTRTLSGLAGRIAAIPSPSGLNGRFTGPRRRVVLRSGEVLFRGKVRVPLRVVGRRRR